jgi:hypothetical protein
LWAARRAYDVIVLLLFLLGSKGSKARSSEGLGLRAGMMDLWLGTVEAIRDLPFFVTILLLNILPHRTKVGGETVEVTGQTGGTHRCSLAVSGRWLRCNGRRVNGGTRLEDRGIGRKIRSSRLYDG